MSTSPQIRATPSRSIIVNIHLMLSALGTVSVLVILATVLYNSFVPDQIVEQPAPYDYDYISMNEASGDAWMVRQRQKDTADGRVVTIREGALLQAGELAKIKTSLPSDLRLKPMTQLSSLQLSSRTADTLGFEHTSLPGMTCYDQRGYLLIYGGGRQSRGLQYIVAADRVSPARSGPHGRPLTTNPRFYRFGTHDNHVMQVIDTNRRYAVYRSYRSATLTRFPRGLLVDGLGVYFVSEDRTLRVVIDAPIDAFGFVKRDSDEAPRALVFHGRELIEYRLCGEDGTEQWYATLQKQDPDNRRMPLVTATRVRRSHVPEFVQTPVRTDAPMIGMSDVGYTYVSFSEEHHDGRVAFVPFDETQSTVEFTCHQVPRVQPLVIGASDKFFMSLLPPMTFVAIEAMAWLDGVGQFGSGNLFANDLQNMLAVFAGPLAGVLIAMIWSVYLGRVRCMSLSRVLAWAAASIPLGLAAPLAIVAISAPPIQESCGECGKRRRVDLARCEHCGAGWEPPPREGIELFDHRAAVEQATCR